MELVAEDLERRPPHEAMGRSKVYSRRDLTGETDPRLAFSAGAFLGPLVTLFGPPDPFGGYVLRHRASGLVFTAYSAQSGPSYGGAVRTPDPEAFREASEAYQASSAVLARARSPEELAAGFEAQRIAVLRMSDLRAPEGMPEIVRALERLLARTPLGDFELKDAHSDFGTYVVGVRGGVPFEERIGPPAGVRAAEKPRKKRVPRG